MRLSIFTAEGCTVLQWLLRYWLTTRTRIRPTTLRSYEVRVKRHLIRIWVGSDSVS